MSELFDTVLRARRLITPEGERAAALAISGEQIVALTDYDAPLNAIQERTLAPDEVLLPGLVDTHVHVNEPGRTEWEGFASASAAAAAGGVTTLIDMPLNSIPPTTTLANLRAKQAVADGQCFVDVGFFGGAVPDNLADLAPLHEAGVFGFKCFLLHSGVEEFPHLDVDQLGAALAEVGSFGGMVIVHAEDAELIDAAPPAAGREYADFLRSRPKAAEERAIADVIEQVRRTGTRAHILHLSDADALPMIAQAQREGLPITAETCPHYLTLAAEEIAAGATQFKCCPPIREAANRDRLWGGLAEGTIGTIVSDHSPCTPELKRFESGDFGEAWGGIASLQLGLPAIWTEAQTRGFTLDQVVDAMARATADQVGLSDRGRLQAGARADLVVFAPQESFQVDVRHLRHKNPVSAYAGRELVGVVRETWLAGVPIDLDAEPRGLLITRPGRPQSTSPGGNE